LRFHSQQTLFPSVSTELTVVAGNDRERAKLVQLGSFPFLRVVVTTTGFAAINRPATNSTTEELL
jgi:hypothetical protein